MKAMEAFKEIMTLKNLRHTDVCERLGIKSNVLSERFKQKNVSITKLNEMLDIADYKIVLMPKDSPTPVNSFEITND